MRQALVNENPDLVGAEPPLRHADHRERPEGQDQLGNFIDPEAKFPVLVTTSRLLSTGVDAQTCRLIVLDRPVGSMTEFKQILGRGTRVHEDTHKYYFTLMDFRGATHHFADPDFDGEPVQIYDPDETTPSFRRTTAPSRSARTRSSSMLATTSRSSPTSPTAGRSTSTGSSSRSSLSG